MHYNRSYYQNWLLQLEARELEVVGFILALDVELYEIQKVVHLIREMEAEEEDNYWLGSLLFSQIRLKNSVEQYRDELADITLDISHCRFMIARLGDLDK